MSATEAEERAQFTLAMRAKGINDLDLLRALERAPRALFMPQRFADISGRDIALPIGCGQTSPPPSIVAAMIAALELKPSRSGLRNRNRNRLLHGAARPTCEARSCRSSGSRRWRVEASARIKAFGLANVAVLWADGFDFHRSGERFDKVIVHGLIEPPARGVSRPASRRGAFWSRPSPGRNGASSGSSVSAGARDGRGRRRPTSVRRAA